MSALKDITAQRFGRLVVIRRAGSNRGGSALWLCHCDCGNSHTASGHLLRSGNTKSCGCGKGKTTHGRTGERVYRIWSAMIQRCENPNSNQFPNYGERGITVCDEWHDAAAFIAWALANGYQDGLEIDRRNNDGNYEPSNCRWVTSARNKRNMRTTRMVEWRGKIIPLADLADITGIPKNTLRGRLFRQGMSVEDAVTIPRDTWQTRRLHSR